MGTLHYYNPYHNRKTYIIVFGIICIIFGYPLMVQFSLVEVLQSFVVKFLWVHQSHKVVRQYHFCMHFEQKQMQRPEQFTNLREECVILYFLMHSFREIYLWTWWYCFSFIRLWRRPAKPAEGCRQGSTSDHKKKTRQEWRSQGQLRPFEEENSLVDARARIDGKSNWWIEEKINSWIRYIADIAKQINS